MNFITNTLKQNIMPSCCLHTQTNEDFYEHKNLFDFSDYPRDSNFLIFLIKKVIGKMKDAFKGEIINKFVGLKSKKYPLVSVYGKEN